MNNKFDELTKSMAQAVTRSTALKTFGTGLAGMALARFGLTSETEAGSHYRSGFNNCMHGCVDGLMAQGYSKEAATTNCLYFCGSECSF